jgi:hypothetical protein
MFLTLELVSKDNEELQGKNVVYENNELLTEVLRKNNIAHRNIKIECQAVLSIF